VTTGVYRHVRHPMYAAFFLWAIAQALLLPNWIAGPVGLLGFGTLFGLRVGREERMMEATFGDAYRAYAARPLRRCTSGWAGRSSAHPRRRCPVSSPHR
jgi:protein-S-isoprenylcysteine O-methyltransferase Ste14